MSARRMGVSLHVPKGCMCNLSLYVHKGSMHNPWCA